MENALLITNLKARTVSRRVQQVIIKALSADLRLEVADTAARNHATELARDAADRGLDLVIAFGGDGTMNEVVNGLVGSDTALAVLPGGMANVLCRTIGVPTDIVEATGHLLNRVRAGQTRQINIGKMDDRYFVLSCGVGLDAATVKRTEENPSRKRKYRDWFFVYSALQAFFTEYRARTPDITLTSGDFSEDVILAVISNTPYFTFFKEWPLVVTPRARLEGGLDVLAMRSLPMGYVPGLVTAMFRGKPMKPKRAQYLHDVSTVSLVSSGDAFPIQLDGEYVGDRTHLKVESISGALSLLH